MSGTCPITGQAGQCPVIKNVNDQEAEQEGVQFEKASPFDFDNEFSNEIPSVREYKKLRAVMTMITGFYENGTRTKGENYKRAAQDLEGVDKDIEMSEAQLQVIKDVERFKGHLKHREYITNLEEEMQRLMEQRALIQKHYDESKNLHDWSKGIVEICKFLEANFDHYCKEKIPDLPQYILDKLTKAENLPELDSEVKAQYSKGLDEIMHNLNESRDFFQAAVDGRYDQYQEIEKEMIEMQLDLLKKYPEDSARRQYIESELMADLKHTNSQLEKSTEDATIKRRQRMLDLHLDFLKVLDYFRNKLHVLDDGVSITERTFDPKFTQKFVVSE